MRRVGQFVACLAVICVGTCFLGCRAQQASSLPPPRPQPARSAEAGEVVPTPVSPAPLNLGEQLRQGVVTDRAFAVRELYTWTTAEQVEALARSRVALVADAYSGQRMSLFNRSVIELADSHAPGHDIAQQLHERENLRKRRYAWPRPFATVLGLGPRGYGDRLVAIRLADDAMLARFEPAASNQPFSFVDMQGNAVPIEVAKRQLDRLAAVFHVRYDAQIAFREYVVCNESMIEQWSVATPAIRAQVDREIALLEQLAAGPFAHLPRDARAGTPVHAWKGVDTHGSLLELWRANLAFASDRYRPTASNMQRIVAGLEGYRAAGPALVVQPSSTALNGQASR